VERAIPQRLASCHVTDVLEALTWGEMQFGVGRRYGDLVVVHAGREVEARLVLGGYLLPHPAQLGHTSVDRTGSWKCPCGRIGCLQILLAKAAEGLAPHAASLPSTIPTAPTPALSYLGLAMVHLINVVNPAAIVLAGPLIDGNPDAVPWLGLAMRHAALATSRAGLVEVARPHAGALSALVGAAAFARGFPPDSLNGADHVEDAGLHS
jgi:predicted NBD/HSP70 family sugar kinase